MPLEQPPEKGRVRVADLQGDSVGGFLRRFQHLFRFLYSKRLHVFHGAKAGGLPETPVSIGQGGSGLGTMWGWETAERMLHEAGFATIERHVLPHDPMNVWFVSRV